MENLNERQYEAVTHGDGPLLILAGAGSGKTRVLVHRIAYLVSERGVNPWNILAVTFTNKAAGEMRERLGQLLGTVSREMSIGTFHSICAGILRRNIDRLGFGRNFVIYDDKDQLVAVKTVLEQEGIDEKILTPRRLQSIINNGKNEGLSPAEAAARRFDFFKERIVSAAEAYEKLLIQGNALDFGDLIFLAVRLFKTDPDILERYLSKWRHILVDEYQDTNRIQYEFIKLLAGKTMNMTVVGDDDQSIYRWRGADIQNILDFERDFPGARLVRLEQNYRSTQRILDAAGAVIEKNTGRKGKKLWTETGDGESITICRARNEYDEAKYVIDEVESQLLGGHLKYSDFAFFYRTNAQSRVIEDGLVRRGMPYNVVGAMKFYDRTEIKDILAYLRVIINPGDAVALKRIINKPARGIGKKAMENLEKKAMEFGVSLYGAVEREEENKKVRAFHSIIKGLMERKDHLAPADLLDEVLEKSGYLHRLEEENSIEARSRLENIDELREAISEMSGESAEASIEAFLEKAALMSDADSYDDKQERLTLMTLHSAKGLEFPVVFMLGMEEGLFPHSRSKDDPESMEEERRLCYVGMTRAKERLYLTYAASRKVFHEQKTSIPSRYLSDIPERLKRSVNIVPSYSGFYGKAGGAFVDAQAAPFDGLSKGVDPGGLSDIDGFPKGSRVYHPTFGEGVVRGGEGSGDSARIAVYFPRLGLKKLALKYASLKTV